MTQKHMDGIPWGFPREWLSVCMQRSVITEAREVGKGASVGKTTYPTLSTAQTHCHATLRCPDTIHGHHKSELSPCIALNSGSKEQLSSQVTGSRIERNQRFSMKVLASRGLRNRSSERASSFQPHTVRMWLNYGIDPEMSNSKSYFLFHTLSSC